MIDGARMIFPNIAVKDLDRSVAFFTELGFSFDARFTNENAAAMIVNDGAIVMLLTEPFFRTFTSKELVDATRQAEVSLALSAESREDVDTVVDRALEVGGAPAGEPMELGFMYSRSFQDPDGHDWSVIWMDMAAVAEAGTAAEATAR